MLYAVVEEVDDAEEVAFHDADGVGAVVVGGG